MTEQIEEVQKRQVRVEKILLRINGTEKTKAVLFAVYMAKPDDTLTDIGAKCGISGAAARMVLYRARIGYKKQKTHCNAFEELQRGAAKRKYLL